MMLPGQGLHQLDDCFFCNSGLFGRKDVTFTNVEYCIKEVRHRAAAEAKYLDSKAHRLAFNILLAKASAFELFHSFVN